MLSFIFGLVFAVLMLLTLALNKVYYHVPQKELKRRARAGDKVAERLYHTSAYGMEVRLLLGAGTVIFAAVSFVLLASALVIWLAAVFIAILLWLGFLWIPSTRLTGFGESMGVWCSAPIAWALRLLHPVLSFVNHLGEKHYPFHAHTGLYDHDDIVNLLEWQKEQPDNRIPVDELSIAGHALTFGGKLVRDVLTPQRVVHTVSAKESISPIIIDELHKTGHSRFPVYEGKKDKIVGTLYLRDLVASAKKTGAVSSIMKPDVYYVHEDFSLHQALQAFLKTKHQMFIVVNKFEEFVGIITIEDILEQIVGQPIPDDFDDYENPRAVAESLAQKEHKSHKKADIELTDDELNES